MQFSTIVAAAMSASVATATLTYNVTQAFKPGQFEKYRCLTTAQFAARLPKCLQSCQINGARLDGCAIDDYACRCVNTQVFSDIIEPCAFPPQLGGNSTCTLAELGPVRAQVTDLCNFFNATLYTNYLGCGLELSVKKTIAIVAKEKTVISY